MKLIALSAIRFYQRALSPHKGFCCAYAVHTGRGSCSALGYRAIRRHGLWDGLALLNRRLEKCGVAHRRFRPTGPMALGRQGGFLDCLGACDVAACDVGSCDLAGGAMDTCGTALECSTCDCSWLPWRRRRSRGDDQYVVIPARGNVRN